MEVKINVPESQAEIILEDYQRFLKIERDNSNEQFIRQKMIEIFCHVPGSVVMKMKHRDFDSISNHLLTILQEKPELTRTFRLDGTEYGIIPNMDADMQVGEYVDLDNVLSDNDKLHVMMAILYRPVKARKKEKYQIEGYEPGRYDEIMKKAPLDVVTGVLLFFYRLGSQLLSATPRYLQRAVEKMGKEADSDKNGDGISTYISSVVGTSSNLMKYYASNLERHCYGLRTTGTLTTK